VRHTLKYIYLLFTLFFLVVRPVWAATSLTCLPMEQDNTTLGARWVCPELDTANNTLNAVLSDVDVETGKYTCEYHYIDSGSVATSCTYLSTDYKDKVDTKREAVRENVAGAIEKKDIRFDANIINYYKDIIGDNVYTIHNNNVPQIVYDRILNSEANVSALMDRIEEIIGLPGSVSANKAPKTLKEYFVDLNKSKGRLVELYDYLGGALPTNVNNPQQDLDDSYDFFVKPYISGEGNRGDGNTTFSNFITQIVTLDSEIINGYNDTTGKLKLSDEFNKSIVKLKELNFTAIKEFFTQENTRTHDLDTSRFDVQKWADIFEQRIWGFYYNVQRRFDIGYDIISTQLLFIMMVFFSVMMAARGGARYIINRENGESSGEVKINEASIMKTLGILATVFAFYISVPTEDKSTPTTKYEDIRTNQSLSKEMIRYAMKQGSDFGTMMADLGTDAFLHYIVSRQGLDNFERNNVIGSMMSMVYYFPAMQFVNTCRMQYGTEDNWVGGANNSVATSSFFAKHKDDIYLIAENSAQGVEITGLSDRLCRKMYARTAYKLTEVDYDFEALLAMIQKDMYVRMNATSSLVSNHIKLQKDLGWMNIASVPYTYFMMKNMHLFFTASVDYEKITEQAQKFTNNLGLRDSQDSLNSTLWAKDIKESESRVSSAVEGAKNLQSEYTRYAVYNFLPGFTSIRNEVLQRVQSLYSDILRIQQSDREHQSKQPLKDFKQFLKTMVKKAGEYARGTKIKGEEILKLVNLGIPDGNIATQNPVQLHQAFIKLSYMMAMAIWKNGFIIVFLSAIAMIVGLKIVLYIINIMIHFFISPFIVVWAFATSPDGGATKIKNYLRDTLIYMLYPTIIVIGVFMFIFAYEFFYSIYGFITSVLINGQEAGISNAIIAANPKVNPGGGTYTGKDGEMAYLAVYALKDITEILIDLLSVYVAFLTINKFPELVLKMMGVGDSAVIMLPQSSEAIQSKGGGSVNPLSR